MLEVKDIVKSYKSKSGVVVKALKGISLKFPDKGMIFILGKSGSGKSTLLNVLGGLDNFDSGDILINGESTKGFKQSHFDSFRNTYVGFIFQEYNILDNFTVGQNIALAMQLQSRKPTSENIDSILKEVDLSGLGDRKPNELSGGQKQRVAIARALIKNPQIIMADEPTGALDSNTGIQIFDTLKKLSEKKLVIIISHDREFSERYADRIIELKDGNVISDVSLARSKSDLSKENENISLTGNEIVVKSDYVLKEKDLKIINEYLKKIKNDASIVVGKTTNKVKTKNKFVTTDERNIKSNETGFSLIKSKLPLRRAFQMGASGLKHKKFKLGMTIVLSLVAFTMLGASITIALTNENAAIANAMSSSDYTQLSVSKFTYYVSNFAGNVVKQRSDTTIGLTDDEVKELNTYVGGNTIKVNDISQRYTGSESSQESSTHINISGIDYTYSFSDVFFGHVNRFADSSDEELTKAGYTIPYKGTLSNTNVYISKYAFDSFKYLGLKYTNEGGQTKTLDNNSSFDDLKGGKITISGGSTLDLTITGMFTSDFDLMSDKYKQLLESKNLSSFYDNPLYTEIKNAMNSDLDGCIIGGNGFSNKIRSLFSDGSSYQTYSLRTVGVIKKAKLDNNGYKTLLNKLSKETDKTSNTVNKCALNNQMLYNLEKVLTSVSPLRVIFLYIGLAFIVFSGLLLANFIANSISYQKREIGILRAIGARGKDVFKIYISEASIIATVNFVFSTISTWAVLKFAVSPQITKITSGVSILKFGIIEILILLGVSFLSAFIATYIPVNITAKKKPVEAIRNK